MIVPLLLAVDLIAVASIAGTAIAVLTFLGALYFGFFKGQRLSGQLAQKDEIIKTREQTIAAFEDRIGQLEADLGRLIEQARFAEQTIVQLRNELAGLGRYAAPEAFERLNERLVRIEEMLTNLTRLSA